MINLIFLYHLLELTAALAASLYLFKTKDNSIRQFVWYLWFIVFFETLGMYGYLYEIMDNPIIDSIKNSKFRRTTWLYNVLNLIVVFLLGKFIINNTNTLLSHKIVKVLVIGFFVFCLVYFTFTTGFFEAKIPYPFVVLTFVIFIMVMLYLRELIKSNKLLNFYKSPVFYVIIAVMLWYICLTPLFIFNPLFSVMNKEFIVFRMYFLDISNIILYSWYTFVFLYFLRFRSKSVLSK
jgi:hypothetical protein